MDVWPTYNSYDQGTSKEARRKGKDREPPFFYPSLNTGSLTAATLRQNSTGRFEWISAVGSAQGKRLVAQGVPATIFPCTRSKTLPRPQATILQRAEQGAHFLRTHYPDVDIAADLIRDELTADANTAQQLSSFDPLVGNTLAVFHGPSSKSYIAFPMGDLNLDLNISVLNNDLFQPTAQPFCTFQTPIQQIIASDDVNQDSYFAVRTFGSVSVFHVENTSDKPRLGERMRLSSADSGDRPLVDLKLRSSLSYLVGVNDVGDIYQYNVANGTRDLNVVHATEIDSPDSFWRVSLTGDYNLCTLASHQVIQQVDFRAPHRPLKLYSLLTPGAKITSIEDSTTENLIRSTSTDQVLWIDNRFPGKPLLGYNHNRQYDLSIQSFTISTENTSHTCLFSRENGLVSVYDVSRPAERLLQSNRASYLLPSLQGYSSPNRGRAFVHSQDDVQLFELGAYGSLHQLNLLLSECAPSTSSPFTSQKFHWSEEVKSLEKSMRSFQVDSSLLGIRDLIEVNMRPIYEDIFCVDDASIDEQESATIDDFFTTIPTYLELSEKYSKQMVILPDFTPQKDLVHPARAAFLNTTVLNTSLGYASLMDDRLPLESLSQAVSWSHNILPVLETLDTTIRSDTESTYDELGRFDLVADPNRSTGSLQRETDAREQLTMDLALSQTVLSRMPFADSSMDDLETMSRAAEALSIGDELPSVSFGYLRPKMRTSTDEDMSESQTPIGVRLLLQEWSIGTNPREYTYTDPYDESVHNMQPPRRSKAGTSNPAASTQTHSQAPPTLLVSSRIVAPPVIQTNTSLQRPATFELQSQPARSSLSKFTSGSQPTGGHPSLDSSQQLMPSTQILPGPFGGRQATGKKKPPKKRLGGF